MKKLISLSLAMILTVFTLSACAESRESIPETTLQETQAVSTTETESETETTATQAETTTEAEGTSESQAEETSSILVAYFSWADNAILAEDVDAVASPSVISPGNVQQLAGWVQEATGGDLFSIRVTEPYPSDWDECLSRANQERGDDARPQLVENVNNLEQYDTVFLGYPKMEQGYICV